MLNRRFLFLPVLLAVPLALASCGIVTYPVEGPKAALVDSQIIPLEIDLVDQNGAPLDDVRVAVTRHSLEATGFLPGEYSCNHRDPAILVDRHFSYNTSGSCAVTVTFSKPGYETTSCTYANTDHINSSPNLLGHRTDYYCININKTPPDKIILDPTDNPTPPAAPPISPPASTTPTPLLPINIKT